MIEKDWTTTLLVAMLSEFMYDENEDLLYLESLFHEDIENTVKVQKGTGTNRKKRFVTAHERLCKYYFKTKDERVIEEALKISEKYKNTSKDARALYDYKNGILEKINEEGVLYFTCACLEVEDKMVQFEDCGDAMKNIKNVRNAYARLTERIFTELEEWEYFMNGTKNVRKDGIGRSLLKWAYGMEQVGNGGYYEIDEMDYIGVTTTMIGTYRCFLDMPNIPVDEIVQKTLYTYIGNLVADEMNKQGERDLYPQASRIVRENASVREAIAHIGWSLCYYILLNYTRALEDNRVKEKEVAIKLTNEQEDEYKKRLKEKDLEIARLRKELEIKSHTKMDEKDLEIARLKKELLKESRKEKDAKEIIAPQKIFANEERHICYDKEEELYEGEISQLVGEIMEEYANNAKDSRKKDVAEHLAKLNPHEELTLAKKEIDNIFSGNSNLDAGMISRLEKLGFTVVKNKHYKLKYYNQDKYTIVMGSSTSDYRAGRNIASIIKEKCF
ncbi:hypothetical protein [Eubacterium oxidoreducens]|uniref:Uncharacterized protein n=1 Tax=Eubacterium oxidoreducens TaxID=1732 RepID=A0A1G6B243_EUBOX|nr:hypothetical protein [Eubacterium oxidoreducens]SDB14738.1 hypothetical protein SAMN02910417_01074 [Eubacterium oxidoreducens]